MDTTLKLRMWKVAIAHFLLSAFVLWKAIHYGDFFFSPPPLLLQTYWSIYYVLQPLFGVGLKLAFFDFADSGPLIFGSIPLWSLCFAWLFVKLDNWLNHFPVLGRKVF